MPNDNYYAKKKNPASDFIVKVDGVWRPLEEVQKKNRRVADSIAKEAHEKAVDFVKSNLSDLKELAKERVQERKMKPQEVDLKQNEQPKAETKKSNLNLNDIDKMTPEQLKIFVKEMIKSLKESQEKLPREAKHGNSQNVTKSKAKEDSAYKGR